MSCSISFNNKKNKNENNKNENNKNDICMTKDDIFYILEIYNNKNPKNKIIYSKTESKETLWKKISDKMKKTCGGELNQKCHIKNILSPNDPLGMSILQENFKPNGPKGQNDWLSTSDINNVMYHYEKLYPNFVFIGAIPRDFFMIIDKINTEKLRKSANKIGMVFNTDKHNQSGSHWLAVFIDMTQTPHTIEHFDSVGNPPLKLIRELLNRLKKNFKERQNKEAVIKINRVQHQRGNNDCGVYSLHYIIERLKGKTFEEISKNIIRDPEMNRMRNEYFYNI